MSEKNKLLSVTILLLMTAQMVSIVGTQIAYFDFVVHLSHYNQVFYVKGYVALFRCRLNLCLIVSIFSIQPNTSYIHFPPVSRLALAYDQHPIRAQRHCARTHAHCTSASLSSACWVQAFRLRSQEAYLVYFGNGFRDERVCSYDSCISKLV